MSTVPLRALLLLSLGGAIACSGKDGDTGNTGSTTEVVDGDCDDDDGDAICNDVDVCAGFPDQADYDADGTPDGCDGCPLDASGIDGDEDGDDVCDASDVCPGFDDSSDYDEDGVPNGCDDCADDASDSVDTDGDGVCDAADICEGSDDLADSDGDLVPDGCDDCPLDDPDDTDGDGVCDTDDVCFGDDAAGDTDGDGNCDDNVALAPPTDFSAEGSGIDVALSWTNNTDTYFGTTVIVRQYVNIVDGAPASHSRPTVGDAVGTTGEIVYIGNGTSFNDTGLNEGAAYYQAFTISSGGTTGDWGTRAWALTDLGATQSGQLSIDLSTGVVTVGTSPTMFTLTGSAVVDSD